MKKQTTWLIIGIIVVIIVALIAVFSVQKQEEEVIKIGVLSPQTGALTIYGDWMRKGIELAKEDLEKKYDITIQLIYEDSGCDPQKTSTAANKLVNIDKVKGIIGPFCGGPHNIVAKFLEDKNIIAITPATNLGKLGKNFFSTQTLISKEAKLLAEFAYKNLTLRKIGILYYNNDWGIIQRDAFKEKFISLGGFIIGEEAFDQKTRDFRTPLTKMKEKNPDGIYIVGGIIGLAINQIKELGMNVQILGCYGMENPVNLKVAGENLNGAIYTYRIFPQNTNFVEKYKKKYGEGPEITGANAYDALTILVEALLHCKNKKYNVNCVREFIFNLKNYEGVSGFISFNKETWDVNKPIVIKTVKDGKFVLYEK